ncbi:hypothetical protein ALP40_05464 [Pseudomonas viridiflava]|uniref:Uncharacterized protein n=1 Tax=Pseudomonas viridiflava TaxID=33069 RepID=A0A3M5P552_PSEVI|nr:hypothetical protein ALP40_05464 [Pseudomonas viridiflava]
MFDHHAFRLAGGAGGVDYVGQMRGSQTRDLRVVLTLRPLRPVEGNDRHRQLGHPAQQCLLGQHHLGRAVGQQIINALVGVRRVHRYVSRAGLEHGQHGDQRVQATTGHDRNAVVHAYAQADQVMSQGVGAVIQLVVTQRLLTHLGCDEFRSLQSLSLNTLLQRQPAVEVSLTGIEVLQQAGAFVEWHDVDLFGRGLRRLLQRLQQMVHCALQISADALRIDVGSRLRREAEGFTQIIDADDQRVVAALLGMQHLDALPCIARRLRPGTVAIIEQRIEQRRGRCNAAATLGQRQRCVFVAHQRGQPLMGGADRCTQVLIAQVQTQRQRIDEDAQRPFGGFGAQQAAHQHRAEYHTLATGQARQHAGPAQVKQAGNADAEGACLSAQTQAEPRVQRQRIFTDVVAFPTEVLQVVRQGRLVQIGQHAAEKRFMLSLADAQQGLSHVFAKRYRRTQRLSLARQARLDFMADHLKCAVVHRDVVEHQSRLDPVFSALMADQTDQRSLAQIQHKGRCTRQGIDHQLGVTPDHLHRGIQPFPVNRGAQDVVPSHDRLQCQGEGIEPFAVCKGELHTHDVRVTVSRRDVVIQNALLQRCQRIDVLHIGGTAGYGPDQLIDGCLVELDQGQHLRRDVSAVARNAVFGKGLRATPGGQCIPLFEAFDQSRFVFAQAVQQAFIRQRAAIALHRQLTVLDRQVDAVSLECRQKFVDAHRMISMFSVIAA